MTLDLRRALALLLGLLAPWDAAAATPPSIARIENDIRPLVPAGGAPVTLAQDMAGHHVPSLSVAVIDHGHIVWARAYGLADVASQRRATPRTPYLAGSISKPVAASGAVKLI